VEKRLAAAKRTCGELADMRNKRHALYSERQEQFEATWAAIRAESWAYFQ